MASFLCFVWNQLSSLQGDTCIVVDSVSKSPWVTSAPPRGVVIGVGGFDIGVNGNESGGIDAGNKIGVV